MLPAGISSWTAKQAHNHHIQRTVQELIHKFVENVELTLIRTKLDQNNTYVHVYCDLVGYSDYARLEFARIIHQEYGSKCALRMCYGYEPYDAELIPMGIRVTYSK